MYVLGIYTGVQMGDPIDLVLGRRPLPDHVPCLPRRRRRTERYRAESFRRAVSYFEGRRSGLARWNLSIHLSDIRLTCRFDYP